MRCLDKRRDVELFHRTSGGEEQSVTKEWGSLYRAR